MRIKKVLISVFVVTFFIGHAAFLAISVATYQSIETPKTNNRQINLPQPELKTEIKEFSLLETLEDTDNWIDEEKYPFTINLLETGEVFHGSEVKAKDGEIWLGLFEEKGKFSLRSTKLKIKRVFDEIVDDEKKKMTGKSVKINDKNEPIFLLKNARHLSEGKISAFFKGVTWQEYLNNPEKSEFPSDEVLTTLKEGFVQKYNVGGKNFELKVIKAKNKADERILALILEGEGKRQILQTLNVDFNPYIGTLYWVGDLDRDNKPDFYLELFEHENVDNKVLFLSSKAEKGKLVKKVAYFWTSGC